MPANHPEAIHRPCQAQSDTQIIGLAFESPVQHRAEVVVLALELVEGTRRVAAGQRRLSIFGKRHVVLGVSPADDQQLAAQGQVIHGERADRLEPAEARFAVRLF